MKLVITQYYIPLGYQIPQDKDNNEIGGEFEFFPTDSSECIKGKYLTFNKNFDTYTYRIEMSNDEYYIIPMNNCWLQIAYKNICFY